MCDTDDDVDVVAVGSQGDLWLDVKSKTGSSSSRMLLMQHASLLLVHIWDKESRHLPVASMVGNDGYNTLVHISLHHVETLLVRDRSFDLHLLQPIRVPNAPNKGTGGKDASHGRVSNSYNQGSCQDQHREADVHASDGYQTRLQL